MNFVLRNNKDVIPFNDLSKIVVFDNRTNIPVISTIDYYKNDFITVYTDGSYWKKRKCVRMLLFLKIIMVFMILNSE